MITKPLIPLFIIIPLLVIILGATIFASVRKKVPAAEKIGTIARISIVLVLVFLINMRFMKISYDQNVQMNNLDIMFVLDTTISMWADDGYSGSRIDSAIKDAEYIMDKMDGSNFSLIRFDNRGQILSPFTQDSSNVRDAFITIKAPVYSYANGSNLNAPYEEMSDLLVSSSKKENRMSVVFFMTDGEVTDGSEMLDYSELRGLTESGAVLGYGTEKGGEMYVKDQALHVMDTSTGDYAVSKIDEENMKALASELGIEYIHMTKTENISATLEKIKAASSTTIDKTKLANYTDIYYIFTIPLILMLLAEGYYLIRKGRL